MDNYQTTEANFVKDSKLSPNSEISEVYYSILNHYVEPKRRTLNVPSKTIANVFQGTVSHTSSTIIFYIQ